jgi:DNA-binding CsgD family transcriptional regulator
VPRTTPEIVGRDHELSRLAEFFTAARERGGALLLTGDPGIGKSALANAIVVNAEDSGDVVLRASGAESEAQVPYAALNQLMRPVTQRVEALPEPARGVLLGAIGYERGVTADQYLVGLATLDLLGEVAATGPVLIVIDDAQWVDASTAQVLSFVARRLESDPVGMLLVLRSNPESVLLDVGLPELAVQPLGSDTSRALLAGRRPALSPSECERVLEGSAGNPLALLELPTIDPHVGEVALTARLARAFGDRAVGVPSSTRAILLVAALSDGEQLSVVLAAARKLVEPDSVEPEHLDIALERRIFSIEEDRIVFRHPLMRSAVVQSATAAERRRAHLALAATMQDRPDERAWHHAAAVIEPDEQIAVDLDAAADRALKRGNPGVSLAALERAAELSETSAARVQRLLSAAELALQLGQMQRAATLAYQSGELAESAADRARFALVKDAVDPPSPQDTGRIRALIDTSVTVREAGESDLAVRLLYNAALNMWWANGSEALRLEVMNATLGLGLLNDRRALAVLGQTDPASWAGAVVAAVSEIRPDTLDPSGAALLGTAFLIGGADRGLATLQSALAEGLRLQGRIRDLPPVLAQQVWTSINLADWATAVPAADEGARLGRETQQPMWAAASQIGGSMIASLRGDHDLSKSLAAEAEAAVLPYGVSALLTGIQLSRGVSAIARGDYDEAFAELRREFTEGDPAYHVFQSRRAFGDLAEAGYHAGRIDAVRAIADRIGEGPLTPWHRIAAEYAQPFLVEDDNLMGAAFELALQGEVSRWPTYRVRMLIEYGIWLRRHRTPSEARDKLRDARTSADALGLLPWAERARNELRAAGERSEEREPAAWESLSPQELQVARLAGAGLSNREIGQRLFLSHRTVGSHLYRLFPKLGVTTRAQLAYEMSQADLGS